MVSFPPSKHILKRLIFFLPFWHDIDNIKIPRSTSYCFFEWLQLLTLSVLSSEIKTLGIFWSYFEPESSGPCLTFRNLLFQDWFYFGTLFFFLGRAWSYIPFVNWERLLIMFTYATIPNQVHSVHVKSYLHLDNESTACYFFFQLQSAYLRTFCFSKALEITQR